MHTNSAFSELTNIFQLMVGVLLAVGPISAYISLRKRPNKKEIKYFSSQLAVFSFLSIISGAVITTLAISNIFK